MVFFESNKGTLVEERKLVTEVRDFLTLKVLGLENVVFGRIKDSFDHVITISYSDWCRVILNIKFS